MEIGYETKSGRILRAGASTWANFRNCQPSLGVVLKESRSGLKGLVLVLHELTAEQLRSRSSDLGRRSAVRMLPEPIPNRGSPAHSLPRWELYLKVSSHNRGRTDAPRTTRGEESRSAQILYYSLLFSSLQLPTVRGFRSRTADLLGTNQRHRNPSTIRICKVLVMRRWHAAENSTDAVS